MEARNSFLKFVRSKNSVTLNLLSTPSFLRFPDKFGWYIAIGYCTPSWLEIPLHFLNFYIQINIHSVLPFICVLLHPAKVPRPLDVLNMKTVFSLTFHAMWYISKCRTEKDFDNNLKLSKRFLNQFGLNFKDIAQLTKGKKQFIWKQKSIDPCTVSLLAELFNSLSAASTWVKAL